MGEVDVTCYSSQCCNAIHHIMVSFNAFHSGPAQGNIENPDYTPILILTIDHFEPCHIYPFYPGYKIYEIAHVWLVSQKFSSVCIDFQPLLPCHTLFKLPAYNYPIIYTVSQ